MCWSPLGSQPLHNKYPTRVGNSSLSPSWTVNSCFSPCSVGLALTTNNQSKFGPPKQHEVILLAGTLTWLTISPVFLSQHVPLWPKNPATQSLPFMSVHMKGRDWKYKWLIFGVINTRSLVGHCSFLLSVIKGIHFLWKYMTVLSRFQPIPVEIRGLLKHFNVVSYPCEWFQYYLSPTNWKCILIKAKFNIIIHTTWLQLTCSVGVQVSYVWCQDFHLFIKTHRTTPQPVPVVTLGIIQGNPHPQ